MNREGHAGLSLIIASLVLFILNLTDVNSIIIAMFFVVFSSLPDIDLRLEVGKHRTYTHNMIAGVIFGSLIGTVTYYGGLGFIPGFLGGFGGTLSHLLGDSFTYMKFKPFWPLKKEVGFCLFHSNNKAANRVFAFLGSTGFVLYLLFKVAKISLI